MAEVSPVFPDSRAGIITLPTSDRADLEPFGETRGRQPATAPLAHPHPRRIGAKSLDKPHPVLKVTVGEYLIEDQIEVLVQFQRFKYRRVRPKEGASRCT